MATLPEVPPNHGPSPIPDFEVRIDESNGGYMIDVHLGYGDTWLTMQGESPEFTVTTHRVIGPPYRPLISMSPELVAPIVAALRALADGLEGAPS